MSTEPYDQEQDEALTRRDCRHPGQPRPRRKWRKRPWRCNHCQTWWIVIAVRYADPVNSTVAFIWLWRRAEI